MIPREVLDIIVCPTCKADDLGLEDRPTIRFECGACGAYYPVIDGIPDLAPRASNDTAPHYRTEKLYDTIAPIFDLAFPLMSMTVWNCPPLRYVDWAHRAMGRGEDGLLLTSPVGTGFILKHVQSVHTQFPIVATDVSWRMLRKAQARFKRGGNSNITLIKAEPAALPFKDGVFRSVMTLNGVSGFYDREEALGELARVSQPGGWVAGSGLCRGLERLADRVLNQYEKWGVYPILRSREFLISELTTVLNDPEIRFETHGATVFFMAQVNRAQN